MLAARATSDESGPQTMENKKTGSSGINPDPVGQTRDLA